MKRKSYKFGVFTLISVLVMLILGMATVAVKAHDDYDWIRQGEYQASDGSHCCGKNDCKILPVTQVRESNRGYIINTDWGIEFIDYKDAKISQDKNYWRCHYTKLENGGIFVPDKTRCFFAPKQNM